ncbi:hypothetical protein V8D89_013821 [Ganoderma adspersum]
MPPISDTDVRVGAAQARVVWRRDMSMSINTHPIRQGRPIIRRRALSQTSSTHDESSIAGGRKGGISSILYAVCKDVDNGTRRGLRGGEEAWDAGGRRWIVMAHAGLRSYGELLKHLYGYTLSFTGTRNGRTSIRQRLRPEAGPSIPVGGICNACTRHEGRSRSSPHAWDVPRSRRSRKCQLVPNPARGSNFSTKARLECGAGHLVERTGP